ncbi:hypothetical protein GQ457_09G000220 [Hibiscus cannabinus]
MALIEGNSRKVQEINDENKNNNTNRVKKTTKKEKNKRRSQSFARFGCFTVDGGVDMEVKFPEERDHPSHLVVMVNGLIGSAQNWRFTAKQFLKNYPEYVIVHCSERNSSMLTFDGVDVMGDRLAEEVKSVISRHPSFQKISFVGHSLGGLVARYAIARLFEQDLTQENSQTNGACRTDQLGDSWPEGKLKGKIAGLEPMNFITLASPHLGSRWHRQVPLFHGSHVLEKVAARTSWFLGRTGKHLFLTDGKDGKPPLLLRMVNDWEDLKFMSALLSFRRRAVYANAIDIVVVLCLLTVFWHKEKDLYSSFLPFRLFKNLTPFLDIVGWSTSSLRRRDELPKIKHLPRGDKYPHVVNVETGKTATPDEVPYEAKINGTEKMNMEEEMIRGLTKMSWERADVNNYWANSDGADVVQHMIDNFLL